MSSNNEEFEVLFAKPWKDSGSLVITIPKHVCSKLKITEGSRLQILLYKSLVVLKHAESINYDKEPIPKIFALVDAVFKLFKKLDEIHRKKIFGEVKDEDLEHEKKIYADLRETCSKIGPLLQEKTCPEGLRFVGKFQNVEEVIEAIRSLHDKYYKES
jgi:antitoxin component of MazEF toxin-antitoxin module